MSNGLYAVALLTLTACGRIGFEAGGTSEGVVDAALRASCPDLADVLDEDGDLVGDPCDVCPHVPDAEQTDSDGDRVGDVCDPRPSVALESITFFDGFSMDRPEWSGGRTVQGGQLVVDVATTDSNSILNVPTAGCTMQIAGTITAVGALPQLFIGTGPASGDTFYAELIHEAVSGRRRSLMQELSDVYTELDGVREPAIPFPTGPFTMMLAFGMNRLDARIEIAGAAPALLLAVGTPTVDGLQGIVYVARLSLVIDYAILIQSQ